MQNGVGSERKGREIEEKTWIVIKKEREEEERKKGRKGGKES